MNQKKKKLFRLSPGLLLMALLLLALALSACGDNTATKSLPTTTPGPTKTTVGTTGAAVSSSAGTTITPQSTTASGNPATTTTTTMPAITGVPTIAPAGNQAGGPPDAAGGETGGGDEPVRTYVDPAGQFSFQHAQSWGNTTKPGETIRFTGRDEFISIAITTSNLNPLDFGKADAAALTTVSPGYKGEALKAYKVAGTNGAMVSYTWQAGPSPVTGKMIPSSGRRYYIPGPDGKLAIFTYSSPTNNYDPAGADDFANAFKWLK